MLVYWVQADRRESMAPTASFSLIALLSANHVLTRDGGIWKGCSWALLNQDHSWAKDKVCIQKEKSTELSVVSGYHLGEQVVPSRRPMPRTLSPLRAFPTLSATALSPTFLCEQPNPCTPFLISQCVTITSRIFTTPL